MRYLLVILGLALLVIGCSSPTEPPALAIENMAVYQHTEGSHIHVVVTADLTAGSSYVVVGLSIPGCYYSEEYTYSFPEAARIQTEFVIPTNYADAGATCTISAQQQNMGTLYETREIIIHG